MGNDDLERKPWGKGIRGSGGTRIFLIIGPFLISISIFIFKFFLKGEEEARRQEWRMTESLS